MRTVKEDCITLNINRLMKSFWSDRHISWEGQIKWNGGHSITLNIKEGMALLTYTLRSQQIEQQITLVKAQCYFGGYRHYFLCPSCGTRRYKLIQGGRGFYCRECYGLPYYSQQCGEADGLTMKRHRIESRLMDRSIKRRTHTVTALIQELLAVEDKLDSISLRRFGTTLFR